jgi:Flp pilus assembly protein TadG
MPPVATVRPRRPRPPALRPRRPGRPGAMGQSLLVFALASVLVFGSVGLAVDAGMSYLLGDRLERAAAAAALAGVTYLPSDPTGASSTALEAAARNGLPPNATTTVTPALVPNKPNELMVTVSQQIGSTFLHLLGFGSHTVTRSATAVYLRPITLGQPGSQLGADTSTLGTGGNNYYFLRSEGWRTPRSEGDAFTPDPTFAGGSGQCGAGTCASNPVDMHALSCTGGTDVCSASLPAEGGQSYLIYVPANARAALQVFNPSFAPDGNGNSSRYTYHESDTTFSPSDHTQYGGIQYTVYQVNNQFDHAADTQVSQATFWPIDARNLASAGTYVDVHAPGSPTRSGTPGVYHGWIDVGQYTGGSATNDSTLVTRAQSTTQAPLGSTDGLLPGGFAGTYYRLRVDHLGPNGEVSRTGSNVTAHKAYALRMVVPQGTGTSPCDLAHVPAGDTQGCSVGGLDDMTVFTPLQASATAGATFQIPLFSVPPEYAGQVVTVYIYDPGDVGGGAAYLSIIEPSYTSGTTTVPAQVATTAAPSAALDGIDNLGPGISGPRSPVAVTPASGIPANQAYFQTGGSGSSLFNGQWLRVRIQVPADYNPPLAADGSTYYWNLDYTVSAGASAGDTVTIKAGYDGTPVHLCPKGGITTC